MDVVKHLQPTTGGNNKSQVAYRNVTQESITHGSESDVFQLEASCCFLRMNLWTLLGYSLVREGDAQVDI